jgi:hypothetical protein
MSRTFAGRLRGGLPGSLLGAIVVLCLPSAEATLLIEASGLSSTGQIVAFEAGMTLAGDQLVIRLANVSPVDSRAAADVLSSFYFDIVRGGSRPTLVLDEARGFVFRVWGDRADEPEYYTPQTYLKESDRLSDLVARADGDASWILGPMDAASQPFLGYGLGTVGNSGLAPNSFNPHIVGPPGKHMIDFAIYAGIDIDPVGVLNGSHLVQQGIEFRFTGVAGYAETDIVDLFAFGMGTGPDSVITISMPEPNGMAPGLPLMLAWLARRLRRGSGPRTRRRRAYFAQMA